MPNIPPLPDSATPAPTPGTLNGRKTVLRLPVGAGPTSADRGLALPTALTHPATRDAQGAPLPLVPGLTVQNRWPVIGVSRSEDAARKVELEADATLLALVADDGSTLYMRADALADQLRRARPELVGLDGAIDLAGLRPRTSAQRGLGDWIWREVQTLKLPDDELSQQLDILIDTGLEKGLDVLQDKAARALSRKGAEQVMALIEKRLTPAAKGLFRWNGGVLEAADQVSGPQSPHWAEAIPGSSGCGQHVLLFVHGTASHTLGSFGELPGSAHWADLRAAFGSRVFSYEHRTFSQSPLTNATELLQLLPEGLELALVSHSRGGLVADLLCLDPNQATTLVDDWGRSPSPAELAAEGAEKAALHHARLALQEEERQALHHYLNLLRSKRIKVTHYVRVAAPAQGTPLLAENLDVVLSGLLYAVRKFGAWATGVVAGALATPLAQAAARNVADQGLAFLARVVLEIAKRRVDARVVPGIEAMLPASPLGTLLARANRSAQVRMAVIAGDVEPSGRWEDISLSTLTDWFTSRAFFDRMPNDLVVNTASMYGGVASHLPQQVRGIFVQGPEVNHFRYFRDQVKSRSKPLPQALLQWMQFSGEGTAPVPWEALEEPKLAPGAPQRREAGAASAAADAQRPLVLMLPGIMGSHITLQGDKGQPGPRIWLNPLRLVRGELTDLRMPAPAQADGALELVYGGLAEHLGQGCEVRVHSYDWRLPILSLGQQLAQQLRTLLDDTGGSRLIHLLAHSMGGLVVRAAFARNPGLWRELVARGGRLVMLGTPNHGSHQIVQSLLGASDTVRMLVSGDFRHSLQEVLDVVASFPGVVQLLPAPGFTDTGRIHPHARADDYHQRSTWETYRQSNHDFWFGRRLAGIPSERDLADAREFWALVQSNAWLDTGKDRVACIYGQDTATPCGLVQRQDGAGQPAGWAWLETPEGDGTVTWESGHLLALPAEQRWLMPVDHVGLVSTSAHYAQIESLLLKGSVRGLERLPAVRGALADGAALTVRRPGPPAAYPSPAQWQLGLLGGRRTEPRLSVQRQHLLQVEVKAMDVRFADCPVLCGHYQGDAISGAEALIDEHLVGGALTRRMRMGIHSGAQGEASVVLMPSPQTNALPVGRGAVVVGLGTMGPMTVEALAEAVRTGVLRLLMQVQERVAQQVDSEGAGQNQPACKLRLASLLLGSNSAAQMGIQDSVKAVVLGVLRANRDFFLRSAEIKQEPYEVQLPLVFIDRLELLEVYLDAAITATDAVAKLKGTLERELVHLDAALEVTPHLGQGSGARKRLSVVPGEDYWPRLEVSDADREDAHQTLDAYAVRLRHGVPTDVLRQLLALYGPPERVQAALTGPLTPPMLEVSARADRTERLRFVFMGERALANSLTEVGQPGLLDKLVERAIGSEAATRWLPGQGLGHTLFQLLLPVELKAQLRRTPNLVLVVDQSAANLPWELMEVDGRPLVESTCLIRQLRSARFRHDPVHVDARTALVIANPDTTGFYAQFPDVLNGALPASNRLIDLPGASREGDAVASQLVQAGYQLTSLPDRASALQVLDALFAVPHRVLVVAAHGIHDLRAADGKRRTGVVLSDGLVLSAAEVARLEQVPEIVFLSCCHLGQMGQQAELGGTHRLAYSLARELIELGVRCVVAAGWAVDDEAARSFSQTFFQQLTESGASFAEALQAARHKCLREHASTNTWGAFQAYGDPHFRLRRDAIHKTRSALRTFRAPEELIAWLELTCLKVNRRKDIFESRATIGYLEDKLNRRLPLVPREWLERADVAYALGALYAEAGPDGFEAARGYLSTAITADARTGQVPLAALELLSNCESRSAEALLKAHDPHPSAEALAEARHRVERAVERLKGLIALSCFAAGQGGAGLAERYALLGSAYKRLLMCQLRATPSVSQDEIQRTLDLAGLAYRNGEAADPAKTLPYQTFNRLQFERLALKSPATDVAIEGALEQIRRGQHHARTAFVQTHEVWNRVAIPDGELTAWLWNQGSSPLPSVQSYLDVQRETHISVREWDSVVGHIEFLSQVSAALGLADKAKPLADLARELRSASRAS